MVKPYLDYKDVMSLFECSKVKAYQIIKELREKTEWEETYESKWKGIVIPTDLFLKYFPSCRKALKK